MSPKDILTTPLSAILQTKKSSIKLHRFLLGAFDDEPETKISVGDRKFRVQIINLNPAPPIPAKKTHTETPNPS